MSKKPILKLLFIFIIGIITILLIQNSYLSYNFYNNIFRLSQEQVQGSLIVTTRQCEKVKDCKLQPGDILIRRYITDRTRLIDRLFHPYFTHSAFYLGDGLLVEAVGTEKNREDDIQISELSKSDWLNPDVYNFVIIRPKNYSSKLDIIKYNLLQIANDSDYFFGIPTQGEKKATCADLIYNQLSDQYIINASNTANVITPDYLFFTLTSDSNNFEVIGFNIQK